MQDLATKAADGDGESQIAVTEEELKELNYQVMFWRFIMLNFFYFFAILSLVG